MKVALLCAALPVVLYVHRRWQAHRIALFAFGERRWHALFLQLHVSLLVFGAIVVRVCTDYYGVSYVFLLVASYPAALYGWSARRTRFVTQGRVFSAPPWYISHVFRGQAVAIVVLVAVALSYESISDADWIWSYACMIVLSATVYVDSSWRCRQIIRTPYRRRDNVYC